VKNLLKVFFAVLTAIGGSVVIGDVIANPVVGARFGWVVLVGVVRICLFADMSGRGCRCHATRTFELLRERRGLLMLATKAGQ
jgi:manganese transport protein